MADLDWFFQDPKTKPVEPLSYLHLLRRDIDHCFGVDPDTQDVVCGFNPRLQKEVRPKHPETGKDIWCRATWPGVMAILTGVDHLGMFLLGSDKAGSANRFKAFAKRYMPAANYTAIDGPEVLYQLRNAMMHSFGSLSDSFKDGETYQVALMPPQKELIMRTAHGPNVYTVDAEQLHKAFDDAIPLYAAEVMRSAMGVQSAKPLKTKGLCDASVCDECRQSRARLQRVALRAARV
jgi:hypothetical protein